MILVVAAMAQERDAFLALCSDISKKVIYDVEVFEATLDEYPVIVCLSGVGKVNASFATTVAINHYKPHCVINIGSAGGLQDDQQVGDVVVATTVRIHDLYIGPGTYTDTRFIFEAHPKLVDYALKSGVVLGSTLHAGTIVTGDQFVEHGSHALASIKEHFTDAICVEMEAAAIAGVATRTQTPFLILRALSDVPLHRDNDLQFETFLKLASVNSAAICREVARRIKENGLS